MQSIPSRRSRTLHPLVAPNFQPRFDFNRYGGQLGGPIPGQNSPDSRTSSGRRPALPAARRPSAPPPPQDLRLSAASPSHPPPTRSYKQFVLTAATQQAAGVVGACTTARRHPRSPILVANAAVSRLPSLSAYPRSLSQLLQLLSVDNSLTTTISQHEFRSRSLPL